MREAYDVFVRGRKKGGSPIGRGYSRIRRGVTRDEAFRVVGEMRARDDVGWAYACPTKREGGSAGREGSDDA